MIDTLSAICPVILLFAIAFLAWAILRNWHTEPDREHAPLHIVTRRQVDRDMVEWRGPDGCTFEAMGQLSQDGTKFVGIFVKRECKKARHEEVM